jgi:glutamate-1-semialdehyde 2,1-aminomutase
VTLFLVQKIYARLLLSRAKHNSLQGHPRLARRVARWVPAYAHPERTFFSSDSPPSDIEKKRRQGFERLAKLFRERFPKTIAMSAELEAGISDLAFVNTHRVPFQYQQFVQHHLRIGSIVEAADGPRVRDLDGNWSYDLGGSYGVNLFGSDFYKQCIERGVERVGELGVVLGAYHPVISDNVARLKRISGLDEVSFHMSGTEAVMQAVRLAQYHTKRPNVVRFSGAYHGWWDGVQAGIGNPMPTRRLYTLKEMHASTLRVLRSRSDIACVLVNPIQALNPNGAPASDSTLVASDRSANFDKATYGRWLQDVREVCTARSIVLIFDEVFLGFRLARGGAQEYFGVNADMVTYGKSLGGGLPVGVVCGKSSFMRRYDDRRPMHICFARGTFNSHPYVMATMNEFLRYLDEPEVRASYAQLDVLWDGRARDLNQRLEQLGLPVRVANMTSVWTTLYTQPSCYNWMFQYYLRAEGITMSWIGTGRFIFSHDLNETDFDEIANRFVAAAQAMQEDGWWWKDAALTNKAINRRIMKELFSACLGLFPSGQTTGPAEAISAPCDTSSHHGTGPSESWYTTPIPSERCGWRTATMSEEAILQSRAPATGCRGDQGMYTRPPAKTFPRMSD